MQLQTQRTAWLLLLLLCAAHAATPNSLRGALRPAEPRFVEARAGMGKNDFAVLRNVFQEKAEAAVTQEVATALAMWFVEGTGVTSVPKCTPTVVNKWLDALRVTAKTFTKKASPLTGPGVVVGGGPSGLSLAIHLLLQFTFKADAPLIVAEASPVYEMMHVVTTKTFVRDDLEPKYGMTSLLTQLGILQMQECMNQVAESTENGEAYLPWSVLARALLATAKVLNPKDGTVMIKRGYAAYMESEGAPTLRPGAKGTVMIGNDKKVTVTKKGSPDEVNKLAKDLALLVVATGGSGRTAFQTVYSGKSRLVVNFATDKTSAGTDTGSGDATTVAGDDNKCGVAVDTASEQFSAGHLNVAFILRGKNNCEAVKTAVATVCDEAATTDVPATSWCKHGFFDAAKAADKRIFLKADLADGVCHVEIPLSPPLSTGENYDHLTHFATAAYRGFPLVCARKMYSATQSMAKKGDDMQDFVTVRNAVKNRDPEFMKLKAPLAHTMLYELARSQGAKPPLDWFNGVKDKMLQMKFWSTKYQSLQDQESSKLKCAYKWNGVPALFLGDSCRDANPQLSMGVNDAARLARMTVIYLVKDKPAEEHLAGGSEALDAWKVATGLPDAIDEVEAKLREKITEEALSFSYCAPETSKDKLRKTYQYQDPSTQIPKAEVPQCGRLFYSPKRLYVEGDSPHLPSDIGTDADWRTT